MHRSLCIIPARGGSKRIPRKNIREFLGKPIIAYSIEIAVKSGLFDEVMVSTDDEEIREVSIGCGASVPYLRSEKNSDDYATTMDVINEVVTRYRDIGQTFDYVCCIYPTAPFVKIEHLKEGQDLLLSSNCKSVFPIVEFSYPIWRGLSLHSDNRSSMVWPEHLTSRSQDLDKVYHDAGQWYWLNIHKIDSSLFSDDSRSVVLDPLNVQDIDNETDWLLAEMKFNLS